MKALFPFWVLSLFNTNGTNQGLFLSCKQNKKDTNTTHTLSKQISVQDKSKLDDSTELNIDSDDEDEEAIIEKRRKERQKLLEKLARNQPSDTRFEKISASAVIEDDRENEDDEMIADSPSPKPKVSSLFEIFLWS